MKIFFAQIKKQNQAIFWFFVHCALGISAVFSPYPIILYFYATLLYSLINLPWISSAQKPRYIAEILIYFTSFEGLGRLAGADPYIPYELGKYLLIVLPILGLIVCRKITLKGLIGVTIIVFSIPALLFDESGQVSFNDLKFNYLGLLNIGLGIIFLSSLKINMKQLINFSKLLMFPIISVLAYTIIKTPNLDEVEFTLGANFATTGGFGSNQVSTILGLGVFIMTVCLLLNYRITGNKILDFVVLCLLTGQGLLTFSRGGMLGAFLAILVVVFYLGKLGVNERRRLKIPNLKKYIFPVSITIIIVMVIANSITGGMLYLRYMGETQGTISGSAEKNLNKITTNRSDIFLEDVDLFLEHPVLGVGVGASTYLRKEYKNYAPHVELSRLIAEHGILGICIFVMILFLYFINKNQSPDTISRGILVAFFILGFLATFHSATRTYITPLLIGMSSIEVFLPKKNVQRKVIPNHASFAKIGN